MRIYWRHFACYSFMLTLLGAHVLFQYAVVPNAGDLTDPSSGQIGVVPDLAEACEQWIGRRSLKVPKGLSGEPEGGHDPEEVRTGTGNSRHKEPFHKRAGGTGGRKARRRQSSVGVVRGAGLARPPDPKEGHPRRPADGYQGDADLELQYGPHHRVRGPLLGPQVRPDQVYMNQGQVVTRLPGLQATPHSSTQSTSLKVTGDGDHLPGATGSHGNDIALSNGAVLSASSPTAQPSHLRPHNAHGSTPGRGSFPGQRGVNALSDTAVNENAYGVSDDQNPHHQRYRYTCANIPEILVKRKLGQGVTKQVYLGLHNSRKVAIKMVTRNVIDVMSCIKRLRRETADISSLPGEKHKCYTLPNMKLMKEILLLNQLHHPNLLKLLGYCVRSEETDSTSLQEHGIVAVYEYGLRFYVSNLREWPWQLRLRTAIELADLLEYLQTSPLGSLRISDFKDAHFLLKDGKIKLTDLDDVTSLEPNCQPNPGPDVDLKGVRSAARVCGYDLKCIGGICPGFNAMKNLDNFNRLFFSSLLFGDVMDVEDHMARLRTRLDNLTIGAAELKQILYRFMDVPFLPGYS